MSATVMSATATQTLREIAAEQPSAVNLFARFEIDLCTLADKSLAEACSELSLSLDQLLQKLDEAKATENGTAAAIDPSTLSLTRLIQHIVRRHHQGVRQELPELLRMAHKLVERRAEDSPELRQIEQLIEQLHRGLLKHIGKEEQVLFPVIADMEENSTLGSPSLHSHFKTLTHPVFVMAQEHEFTSAVYAEMRRATKDFELPAGACTTHQALFEGLRRYEVNLREHIRLENDFLFPRAIAMETELQGRR
ncbi:MAG TPA: DUF542 domain-containing protein [Acidisarcina sp.]|nr:DUF542 domain-containing protein [Acidisarcina sp.]